MRPASTVRAHATAEGVVFLDIAAGQMFGANAIGAHIWTRLCEGWSEADVVREIACESGTDEDEVRRDVAAFVEALVARGLLHREARPWPAPGEQA